MSNSSRQYHLRIGMALARHFAKEGFIVHFLQSSSSPSVYIKLDYGAASTIRISDHRSKDNLDYRFNLMIGMDDNQLLLHKQSLPVPKYPRLFFTEPDIHKLILAVKLQRDKKILECDSYPALVNWYKKKFNEQRRVPHRFASKCDQITP